MAVVQCAGCERPIYDRYLLNVLDRCWHQSCVQCCEFQCKLSEKCFSREGKLYCRQDFFRRFGRKCAGCCQGIAPQDLVRRAREQVFHLNCFTCLVCRRQLSTGERLYLLDDTRFVCMEDYMAYHKAQQAAGSDTEDGLSTEEFDLSSSLAAMTPTSGSFIHTAPSHPNHLPAQPGGVTEYDDEDDDDEDDDDSKGAAEGVKNNNNNNNPNANNNNGGDGGGVASASGGEDGGAGSQGDGLSTKRRGPRTTIKAKQLETLKAAFAATPKPTRHIREQLAQETGLNMRVIQVWFQNRRSKERRMKQLSALGARRAFFRNPRRMRALRAGEMDDGGEFLHPGWYMDPHAPDFPYGYPPYPPDFPVGFPGGPPLIPPPPGMMMEPPYLPPHTHPTTPARPETADLLASLTGEDGNPFPSDLPPTSSEPLPPTSSTYQPADSQSQVVMTTATTPVELTEPPVW